MAAPRTSRGGRVLVGALAIDALGNGLFLPLSLIYFTKLTDVPLATLGLVLSAATMITLPVPIWAGTIADRFGALRIVVGAQVLQAVGYLAYAWVGNALGIFVAAALVSVGVRFFWSAVFTAVADYADGGSNTASKDSWYALTNAARTAGLAAGGLATGLAVADGRAGTYRTVAYVAAGCFAWAAAAIAVFVRTGPARVHEHEPLPRSGYGTLLRDRSFLGLTGINTIYALNGMMLGIALPTVVVIGIRGPAWLTSTVLAGTALLIAILSTPVVKRLAGYRRTRIIVAAAALWAVWSFLFASLVPGHLDWVLPVLIGATLLFAIAEIMHAPVSMAIAAGAAPPQVRGRYLASFQYSFAIASIIAPTFFTGLFEFHHGAPWLILGGLNCASIAGMLLLERTLPPAAVRDTAPAVPDASAPQTPVVDRV